MIRRVIIRIIINAVALYIASYYIPGIYYEGRITSLIIGGIVLGFLNAFIKPILVVLSCPFILLTLGLFYIIINTAILYIADIFIPGYSIHSFISALAGSVLISIVNWILSWLFALKKKDSLSKDDK
jgi:putative membrane protein